MSAAPPALTVQANGQAVINDKYLNGMVQSGAVLANLRAFQGLSNMSVWMIGTTTLNDGGQGMFCWSSSSTAADDGGVTTIAVNGVLTGRWLRNNALGPGYLPLTGGTLTGPLVLADTTLSATDAGTFTDTQMNLGYSFETNGLTAQSGYQLSHSGHVATLGFVTTMAVPSASTVYEADGFASYVTNDSTATGACAGSFYAYNLVTGATSYGLNPLVSDQGHLSTVVGAEFDIGASNAGSTAYGINMIGVFPNGTPATAIAYQASVLNSSWQYVMVSYNGTSENFALVGAVGTANNSNGQPIQFNVINSSGTVETCGIQATVNGAGGANLVLSTPTGEVEVAGQFSATGTTNFLDGFTASIAATGAIAAFFSGSTAVGSISTNGTTTAYNTTSDGTLKITRGPLTNSGRIIDRLQARWFNWLSDPDADPEPGFFAQQVYRVFPWAVTRGKGRKGRKGYVPWQMDAAKLMPVVIAELQDVRRRLAVLEAKGGTHP